MPTLRSIGVHPDLRKRLVVASISTTTGNDEEGDSQQQNLIPITTPNALLSVHQMRLAEDETLSASKAIANPQAESLRYDVAIAMLLQSNTGRHWKRIAKAQENNLSDDRSPGQRDDTDSLFPTVLELLQYHHPESLNRIELRIGCPSLDRAIALPPEFAACSLSPTTLVSDEQQLGIPFGFITQFTGPPGGGKSRLARHLGVSCAQQGGLTWWIYSGALPHLVRTTDEVLERIFLVPAMNSFELLARLAELESLLVGATVGDTGSPTLLIVDSCSVCLGAVEDESMYATVFLEIKRLTREYELATVLMNGTVADRQLGGRKPALGQFWSGTADISVWLEAQPIDRESIKAIVKHHFAREASTKEHRFSLIPAVIG